MSLLRVAATMVALVLFSCVIGVCLERSSEGDDAKEPSSTPASSTREATTTGNSSVGEKQLDPWHKNIAQWKEREAGEPADNSFCNVCHANLEDEKMVRIHLPEGVGCETCHGISDEHSEDEDSLIPPDVIFAKSRIVRFCIECHDKDELIDAEDKHRSLFVELDRPENLKTPSPDGEKKRKTCTDCHRFKHTLKNRTRRWNKETGKVEWYDGVRMMQERDKK